MPAAVNCGECASLQQEEARHAHHRGVQHQGRRGQDHYRREPRRTSAPPTASARCCGIWTPRARPAGSSRPTRRSAPPCASCWMARASSPRSWSRTAYENLDVIPADFSYRKFDAKLAEQRKPHQAAAAHEPPARQGLRHAVHGLPAGHLAAFRKRAARRRCADRAAAAHAAVGAHAGAAGGVHRRARVGRPETAAACSRWWTGASRCTTK